MSPPARPSAAGDSGTARGGRWDLSSLYPALDSPAFKSRVQQVARRIDALAERSSGLPALDSTQFASWVAALLELEALEAAQTDILGYLDCLKGEDPGSALTLDRLAEVQAVFNTLATAAAPLLAKLGRADEAVFADLRAQPDLSGAHVRLDELRRLGRHCLSPDEEGFIADAAMDGSHRWANLAAETIASTTFDVTLPSGESGRHAMSERFELIWDQRPAVRLATFKGVEAAFAPKAGLLASCFNAMAGFDHSVSRRRGRDLVEQILQDDHRIDPATVKTMQAALLKHAPVLRSYLELKASLLGLPHLGVQDRSAPLPAPDLSAPDVETGLGWVVSSFERHCPPLADRARQIHAQHWLDSEMRPGKRAGGFCALFPLARETRVFISYGDSLNSVAVLAHELGHAFHDHCNFDQRWWSQLAPAALAETAAILGEHFLRDTVARDPEVGRETRIAALTSQLDAAVNYMLRIPRDFDFELAFLEERRSGDVSEDWLRRRMGQLHAAWFGDTLRGDGGDTLSWAYNHIMMDPRLRLYNFPYSFGYLLSRRIADAFYARGDSFSSDYVAFLRASGSMTVEDAVASTLGFDVTSDAYWADCFASIDGQVALLASLMEQSNHPVAAPADR